MKKTQLNLEEIRDEVKKFYIAESTEQYLQLSGQKADLQLSNIYETYQHLFSNELIQHLIDIGQGQEDDRRINYLISYLVKNYLGIAVKELQDQIATQDAKATIEVDGKASSYRRAELLIANTSDPAKREEINRKRIQILKKHNVMRKEMVEKEHEVARGLGYNSYADLWNEIDGLRLDKLEQLAKDFLQQTEALYEKAFGRLVETYLKIPLRVMKAWDILRIGRAPQFDSFFVADKMFEILKATLQNLGIDFNKQSILLDLEPRETKFVTPFCVPIEVPNRVMLTMMPIEGYYAYKSLFHEAGHALHYSSIPLDTPFEYTYPVSSDYAVPETFSTLIEYLTFDPHWLDTYVQMPLHRDFVSYFGTVELYKIRRYSARLLYEIRLHRDTVDGKHQDYTNLMSAAVKFQVPPERYLVDLNPAFYSAGYLQAWVCYAHLQDCLRKNYGDKWFTNPKAGEFLKEVWATAQKYKAREFVQMLGYDRFEITPLVNYIEELLISD